MDLKLSVGMMLKGTSVPMNNVVPVVDAVPIVDDVVNTGCSVRLTCDAVV